jgi:hypothetical protein
MEKAELIITALQQRIGEIVAEYELKLALVRADYTQLAQDTQDKQKAVDEYSQSLSDITAAATQGN